MRSPHLKLFAICTFFALLAVGCSKQSSRITGLDPGTSAGRAPLISRAASRNAIEGAYIVVFKQTVADVDGVVGDVAAKHGISAQFRYKYALKGFAGRLSPAQIEALRNDPRVDYIEQDQIAHAVAVQPSPPSWGLDRVDQRSLPLDNSYTYNQTGAGVD